MEPPVTHRRVGRGERVIDWVYLAFFFFFFFFEFNLATVLPATLLTSLTKVDKIINIIL